MGDGPWPEILQSYLARIWDMYHEQNLGRVKDKQAHEKEVGKLNKSSCQTTTASWWKMYPSFLTIKMARCLMTWTIPVRQSMN